MSANATFAVLFMGLPLIGGSPTTPPAPLPTPIEMRQIADRAVAFARLEQAQVGFAGLTADVKSCYASVRAHPTPANAAYCLLLDTAVGKAAGLGGDSLAPTYFKVETRVRRQSKLEARVAPPETRGEFIRLMDEAELTAEGP